MLKKRLRVELLINKQVDYVHVEEVSYEVELLGMNVIHYSQELFLFLVENLIQH
jgi:hypothetical protein